jgi:hypothetical protein
MHPTESDPRRQRDNLNPGDQAPAGTPGTGEDLCPKCSGSGRIDDKECENCGGTGIIIAGISGP